MREVESCFQRLEQRYALFTSGPARADRFLETVSPAPADVVRTTLFSVDGKAKNRPAHRKADTTLPVISITNKDPYSIALPSSHTPFRDRTYVAGAGVTFQISIRVFQASPSRTRIEHKLPFCSTGPKFWPLTVKLYFPFIHTSLPAVPIM